MARASRVVCTCNAPGNSLLETLSTVDACYIKWDVICIDITRSQMMSRILSESLQVWQEAHILQYSNYQYRQNKSTRSSGLHSKKQWIIFRIFLGWCFKAHAEAIPRLKLNFSRNWLWQEAKYEVQSSTWKIKLDRKWKSITCLLLKIANVSLHNHRQQ